MWLFSKQGFVSIVKDRYCKDGQVTVRARIRDDLVAILEKMNKDMPEILEIPHADYRFRAIVAQDDFALAVARSVMEIDYDNFKNAACPFRSGNTNRMIAYHRCWEAMRELQEGELDSVTGGGRTFPFWDGETEGEA